MVAIRPFQALRYNLKRVGDLSAVIAPPYDVIDSQEQERLYEVSPFNIVRLILGKQSPMDGNQDNRYTRAFRDFTDWSRQDVLHKDETPALYVIAHTFDDGVQLRSRIGFIGLLGLKDAGEKVVYRHEATLSAPKADRTKLLEAVPANLSPIFCVYPDDGGAIQSILSRVARQTAPSGSAHIKNEEVCLWAVSDPEIVGEIARRLASVAVLIADGHHRFEVAYAKRDRYPALMSYFVSMEDPGLIMRPIHRIVEHGERVERLRLQELCKVEPGGDLSTLTQWLQQSHGQGCFGYFDGQTLSRIQVTTEQLAKWLAAPSVPGPVAGLDVSILHGLVLPALGSQGVRYTADSSQALQHVNGKGTVSAWLLRPLPLRQVYDIAAQGLTLPPKSTYFYPKVPSGLTVNPLQ